MARRRRGHLRALVWERDRGICALCSLDVPAMYDAYRLVYDLVSGYDCDYERRLIRGRLRRLGFDYPSNSMWWEADHIRPVVLGGGDEPGNVRTLCRPCHKRVTAELRIVLANRVMKRKRPTVKERHGLCNGSNRKSRFQRAIAAAGIGEGEWVCAVCWQNVSLRNRRNAAPHKARLAA